MIVEVRCAGGCTALKQVHKHVGVSQNKDHSMLGFMLGTPIST